MHCHIARLSGPESTTVRRSRALARAVEGCLDRETAEPDDEKSLDDVINGFAHWIWLLRRDVKRPPPPPRPPPTPLTKCGNDPTSVDKLAKLAKLKILDFQPTTSSCWRRSLRPPSFNSSYRAFQTPTSVKLIISPRQHVCLRGTHLPPCPPAGVSQPQTPPTAYILSS